MASTASVYAAETLYVANNGVDLGIVVFSAASVIGNAVVGNSDSGIEVLDVTDTIAGNNIFGNTCGLVAPTTSGVLATNNYWGAATGPGADPADDVCGFGATTTPFATKPFNVKVSIKP